MVRPEFQMAEHGIARNSQQRNKEKIRQQPITHGKTKNKKRKYAHDKLT